MGVGAEDGLGEDLGAGEELLARTRREKTTKQVCVVALPQTAVQRPKQAREPHPILETRVLQRTSAQFNTAAPEPDFNTYSPDHNVGPLAAIIAVPAATG